MSALVLRRGGPSPRLVLMRVLLVAALVFGAWWTASAVLAGDTLAVVWRFSLSILLGLYYLALGAIVRRTGQ